MIEREETHFKSNTLFSCAGKVAGFLDHRIMVHPPELTQDRVFIIVPETWQFHDKTSLDSFSISPSATTPAKQPSKNRVDRNTFISPLKPVTQQTTNPSTITALSTKQVSHAEPIDPTPSC